MNRFYRIALVLCLLLSSRAATADTLTATDLLNVLVQEGILTEDAAKTLVEKARNRNQRAAEQLEEQPVEPDSSVVRVPYVPDYVKDEIRNEVEQGLRTKVTEDVVAQAKTERWGVPDALPQWTRTFSLSGDARLRYQGSFFPSDNPSLSIFDIDGINDAGGVGNAGRDGFINVTDDRHRLRGRFRLMVKAKPLSEIEAGMRLVTGNANDPVSSNQTFSMYDAKWETNFDLAYMRWRNPVESKTLWGGRFKNPFLHTDLLWDSDLNFDGVAGTWNWMRSNDLDDDFRQIDPFFTAGIFPIDEINQVSFPTDVGESPDDKWLYAAQLGTHYDWFDQSRLSVGIAYYYFDNVVGVRNEPFLDVQNPVAAPFYQSGNSVMDITVTGDPNDQLWALASEFEVAALTVHYNYAGFAPYQVLVQGEYSKNLAFDQDDVAERIGGSASVPSRDTGFQFGVAVGWPEVFNRGTWQVGATYRRLEGDAMIDAFTDSDFLVGGTNAKGYILEAEYALLNGVWATLRWISADEIDAIRVLGANGLVISKVGVDTLQLDLNTRF